jgi:hypothetical protein
MMDFHSTLVFSMKKMDNSMNSQLEGLSITEHFITYSAETRTNIR